MREGSFKKNRTSSADVACGQKVPKEEMYRSQICTILQIALPPQLGYSIGLEMPTTHSTNPTSSPPKPSSSTTVSHPSASKPSPLSSPSKAVKPRKADIVSRNPEGRMVVVEILASEPDGVEDNAVGLLKNAKKGSAKKGSAKKEDLVENGDENEKRGSVVEHIVRSCKHYAKIEGVEEVWIINFSTRPPGKGAYVWMDRVPFVLLPPGVHVGIIHVYHDPYFSVLKISFDDSGDYIEIPQS